MLTYKENVGGHRGNIKRRKEGRKRNERVGNMVVWKEYAQSTLYIAICYTV